MSLTVAGIQPVTATLTLPLRGAWSLEAELPAGAAGEEALWRMIDQPRPGRPWAIAEALRRGVSVEEIHARCGIDPWFLRNLQEIVETEAALVAAPSDEREAWLRPAKQMGFSDRRIAALWGTDELSVRALRHHGGGDWRTKADMAQMRAEAARSVVPGSIMDDIVRGLAIKRQGTPADLAAMCLFLLSDEASWITGQIIDVDGGQVVRS